MSRASILFRKARVLDPGNQRDEVLDVLVEDGRLIRMGASLDAPGAEIIECEGFWLIPGLIDTCSRLSEPGGACTGSIASETRAAASGGITHLCTLPDTDPVVDSTAVVRLIRERAMKASFARILPLAAMTQGLNGTQLAEMATLQEAGCIGISNAGRPVQNALVLKRCLEYAATFDIPVMLRPQDTSLAGNGCAHEGPIATRLGLPGIPALAETVDLARALLLAAETGVRVHIHQVSSAASLGLLEQAKRDGLQVTADVCIHHLLLDESAIANFNTHCHVIPPLRSTSDREALLEATADGTIDAICSQHTPIGSASKLAPFPASRPGISGVETLLPLTLKLVNDGNLSLMRALDAVTAAPARCLAQSPLGQLETGRLASLCVLDPTTERLPDDDWLSAGKNSPWLNTRLPGIVRLTLCEGRVTWLSD